MRAVASPGLSFLNSIAPARTEPPAEILEVGRFPPSAALLLPPIQEQILHAEWRKIKPEGCLVDESMTGFVWVFAPTLPEPLESLLERPALRTSR